MRGKEVSVAMLTGETTVLFAFWYFQRVKGLQDAIVLVVSLLIAIMKDQVASLEEQMVDICCLYEYCDMTITVLHQLIIPHV